MSDQIERAEAALRRLDGVAALNIYNEPANGAPDDQIRAGRVRAHWLLRHWPEARQASAQLTTLYPDSPHAAMARGVIALGQPDDPTMISVVDGSAHRDDDAAIAAFTEATRLDPASDAAVAGLATAHRLAGRSAEAMALLAEKTAPSNEILMARAGVEIDRDHLDAARAELVQAIAADPLDYRAAAQCVTLDLHTRLDAASVAIDRLVAESDSTVAHLLELQGWIAVNRARRGEDRERQLELADAAFARSMEFAKAPGVFAGQSIVEELRENVPAAVEILRNGLELEPSSPQLKWNLARLEVMGGTSEDQYSRYQQLFDLDRRLVVPRVEGAYVLQRLRRATEARQLLSRLADDLPDRRDLIKVLAWLDIDDGHPERALAGFRRLDRASAGAVVGEVRALRMLGAIEQAEALCEQAIARLPAGWLIGIKREYAFCAMHERRYEHAKTRAQAVLAEDPDDEDCLSILATIKVRRVQHWLHPWRHDDRALELARTDDVRSRLRGEIIPERVRERTLGRLRAPEWDLARAQLRMTRRSESNWSVFVLLAALITAPWWMSTLLHYPHLVWWEWVVVAEVGMVFAATWWTRRLSRRWVLLALVGPGMAVALYLWWQGWRIEKLWELLLVAGVAFPGLMTCVIYGLETLPFRLLRRRHAVVRRRYPLASVLLDLEELAVLLADEHVMASAGARERCARLFESVAAALGHLIRHARSVSAEDESRPDPLLFQPQPLWERRSSSRPLGGVPDALLEQRLSRTAAGVSTQLRQYKRQVLIPSDGTWAVLREQVIKTATLVCERRWDDLPQAEPEKVARRLRARIAVSLRLALIAAAGPAALVAYQVLPGNRPAVPQLVAFALYIGWPLLTVLVRVDPDLTTKLDVFGQWLPGAGKTGSGASTPPRAEGSERPR